MDLDRALCAHDPRAEDDEARPLQVEAAMIAARWQKSDTDNWVYVEGHWQ